MSQVTNHKSFDEAYRVWKSIRNWHTYEIVIHGAYNYSVQPLGWEGY